MSAVLEQCVYCGHREYERGWGCHACGTCTTEEHDAACLREAAAILERRAKAQTFTLRVIIKVLRNAAGRLQRREAA